MQKQNFQLRALLLACGLACGAAVHAETGLSRADYDAAKTSIDADYKAANAQCSSLSGNAKDICSEEAKGRHKVAQAELDYRRSGKPADLTKSRIVKAEADYEVAKERCDDRSGNEKDVCNKEAKAVEMRAKADAKASGGAVDMLQR